MDRFAGWAQSSVLKLAKLNDLVVNDKELAAEMACTVESFPGSTARVVRVEKLPISLHLLLADAIAKSR